MEAPLERDTLDELADIVAPSRLAAFPPPPGWENPPMLYGETVGYVRVSTEDQARRDSPRAQVLGLAGNRRGGAFRCPDLFIIECASGADPDRPGFAWLLRCDPRAIYVTRLDRIARSVELTALLVSNIQDTGAPLIVTATPSIDLRSSTGRLMLWMLAAVAEFERDLIAQRTSAGMMARGGKSHTGPTVRADIVNMRRRGYSWNEITASINERHNRSLARSTIRFLFKQATDPKGHTT